MKDSLDNAVSFISEHTAEYVLVPALKKILQDRFSTVIPIFPWATREGGKLARNIHKDENFRVVGLYPRRPKLTQGYTSRITIKLNHQILLGAKCGMKLGIPMVAGCPLVTNFGELGHKPRCLWIKLERDSDNDFEIEVDKTDNSVSNSNYVFSENKCLLDYLVDRTKSTDFITALLAFLLVKRASQNSQVPTYFGLMGGYKPVYFLLK